MRLPNWFNRSRDGHAAWRGYTCWEHGGSRMRIKNFGQDFGDFWLTLYSVATAGATGQRLNLSLNFLKKTVPLFLLNDIV